MTKEINLKNSKLKILVDDEDYEYLNKFLWKIIKKRTEYNHPYSTHYGRIVRPHRLILNLTNPKIIVDHVNGNSLDNRKENLRICSNKENSRNVGKRKGRYTSRYKGVNQNNSGNWLARITTDKGRLNLGTFKSEVEAAEAYNKAATKYHKEFANFVEVNNGENERI